MPETSDRRHPRVTRSCGTYHQARPTPHTYSTVSTTNTAQELERLDRLPLSTCRRILRCKLADADRTRCSSQGKEHQSRISVPKLEARFRYPTIHPLAKAQVGACGVRVLLPTPSRQFSTRNLRAREAAAPVAWSSPARKKRATQARQRRSQIPARDAMRPRGDHLGRCPPPSRTAGGHPLAAQAR